VGAANYSLKRTAAYRLLCYHSVRGSGRLAQALGIKIMPGCVLRATGNFSPEQFLAQHSVAGASHRQGSLVVTVSDADGDAFPVQIADALAFIERHADMLRALKSFPGVELLSLNFGLWQIPGSAQHITFSPAISSAAGTLGISLTAWFYAASDA